MKKKNSHSTIDSVLAKAFWLSSSQKKMLNEVLNEPSFETNRVRLAKLLCSILYMELRLKRTKKILYFFETVLEKLQIQHYFCETIGMWNFRVNYARRFNYSKREFICALLDPYQSTRIIIQHLNEDIGLNKPNALIFAEYNHGPLCTSIAALQRLCNLLSNTQILEEDGIYGENTKRVLREYADYLDPEFFLHPLSEKIINNTLQHIKNTQGIEVVPFIPFAKKKKGLCAFIKTFLRRPLISNFRNILQRNMDVPQYAQFAQDAISFLE